MSRHFYIENQLIDLPSNVVIAQTLQVFDPGRLGSIVTNFTSSIRLKYTYTNERTLGFLSNTKTKTDVPYTSLSCKYIENGIPLIRDGRVIVNEVNDGYSLSVYSGPWGFFEIIQDLTLWDLDFSDLNGAWSASVRDGLRTATTGIVQALVDDGRLVQDQASSAPTIENQGTILKPPQIYYHTVIEKIFESAGFEYEGDIFTNDIFLKLVMPLGVVYLDPSFTESRMFYAAAPGDQVMVNPTIETDVLFNQNVKQGSENYYDDVSQYVVSNSDTALRFFRLIFFADLTIEVTGGTVDINITTGAGYVDTPEQTNVGSGTYSMSYLSSLGQADGDIIKVTIVANTGTPTVTITAGIFYSVALTGNDEDEFFPTIVSEYVYFQKLFEQKSQIDFLKEFCVRFNVQITQINNVLYVNTMNKILDDVSGPDWTNKRHAGVERIKYSFSTYAKTNFLKTPIDSETAPDLTDEYGNGNFSIPNENIRDSFTLYTSFFKASQMVNTFGVFMIDMDLLPNAANFGRKPGLRLFFVRSQYDYDPPVLYDSVDRTDYLVGYWFDPNQEYEMSFQFFIDNFHQKFIDKCLRKVRLVERQYNLNDLDIFAFNQQVPIRDNNERFLVTKIINRVSGRKCKVELLKIESNPENFFTAGASNEISGELVDTIELIGDDVAPDLEINLQLIEDVTGFPTWQCTFDNAQDTDVLETVGNTTDAGSLTHVGSVSVDANVLKTANDGNGTDGFPAAIGWVEWLRDGVQEHTVTFNSSSHSSLQGLDYTYPNVVAFQVLNVIIHEDGTTP